MELLDASIVRLHPPVRLHWSLSLLTFPHEKDGPVTTAPRLTHIMWLTVRRDRLYPHINPPLPGPRRATGWPGLHRLIAFYLPTGSHLGQLPTYHANVQFEFLFLNSTRWKPAIGVHLKNKEYFEFLCLLYGTSICLNGNTLEQLQISKTCTLRFNFQTFY